MRESREENRFLYSVRFIACLAVITIHTRFPGKVGEAIDAWARFAVPFFFVLSGRFLLAGGETTTAEIRSKIGRSLARLLKTTLVVYLIYVLYSVIYHLMNGETLYSWFISKYNPQEALWFVLFNSGKFIYDGSYTFDHLWFLFALIYVYGLIYIFAPVLRKWYRTLIVILLFFLYFGEALQTYYPIRPFGINISTWYVMRNWLFVGMPFVLLGIYFNDLTGSLKNKLGKEGYVSKMASLKPFAIVSIIFGAVLSAIEFQIFGKKEVFIGTLFIVIGILVLSEAGLSGGKIIWKFGKDSSSIIYYYHVLVIAVFDQLSYRGFIPIPEMWAKPFIIAILCIVLFVLAPYVFNRVKFPSSNLKQ